MTLEELGPRICIMGPSCSGKSTLAVAIAAARGLPVVHLDQLHHRPHTDWIPRPAAEFAVLHDAAVTAPCWVIEGNYSRLLPRRLERATGFILLDVATVAGLWRYLRRCWSRRARHGALPGGADRVKWEMIHHIAIATRGNRAAYQRRFDAIALPKVRLGTARAVEAFRRRNGL